MNRSIRATLRGPWPRGAAAALLLGLPAAVVASTVVPDSSSNALAPAVAAPGNIAIDPFPAYVFAQPVTNGYVMTHEHPTTGMAFGGNYAWAGSLSNYRWGMAVEPYGQCGGCFANRCDHAEFKGTLLGGQVGPDVGDHSATTGPFPDSFTHLRYASRWMQDAAWPDPESPRMQLMVAYAGESEPLCHLLQSYNVGNGGAGGNGWACDRGDSLPSLERQIQAIWDWANNVPYADVALTAAQARSIIQQGNMAVVIGIEADYAFGAEGSTIDPVSRLETYYELGVRTFYLAHKVNSRLAGADVFRTRNSGDGKLARAQQAIQGCFYYDDSPEGPFPLVDGRHNYCDNDRRCGRDHFRGKSVFDNCNETINEISDVNLASYLGKGDSTFNGFAVYPVTSGFGSVAGTRIDANGIERNRLGLSTEGRHVIERAMELGMILNLDHVSKKARRQIKDMTLGYYGFNYPLNAFHNNPNEMLIEQLPDYPGPSEYDFMLREREWIRDSHGIFGVRLLPIDSAAYANSGVSGAANNCKGTATETAKVLASLLDEELNVGFSLDFAAGVKGLKSRWWQGCISSMSDDWLLMDYTGRVTLGLAHIGNMRNFHRELEQVGLRRAYLDQIYNGGTEAFLRMWGRSEGYITISL